MKAKSKTIISLAVSTFFSMSAYADTQVTTADIVRADTELASRIAAEKVDIAQNHTDIANVASINDSQDHVLDDLYNRIEHAKQVRLASDQELAKRIAAEKVEIAQNHTDITNVANVNDSQDHVLDNHADRIAATEARVTGDELTQANRDRTANQHVSPVVGSAGTDGKDGVNGKDGVTTTRIETDTATQNQVKTNTAALAKQDRTNDVQTGQIEVTNQRIDEDRVNIQTNAAKLQGDELAQANRDRSAEQHVQAVVGQDGTNGKDGVTTTKVETDTATQQKVATNETSIRDVRSEQVAQGEFIQREAVAVDHNSAAIVSNAQRIDNNSQRIDRNAKRIDDTRDDLKKGLNNAAAMTGLHYHSNDAYAISAGTANGEGAALAGGLSHGFTEHTAATVQASTSMDGGYMASVGFSGDF